MIHSILMIGQSNMAGRGFREEATPINTDRLKVLRNGRWWPIFFPVNPDRKTAGVTMAESFAERYAERHEGVEVGLIPCADGGTSITQWQEGGLLYDHAVMQARLASRTSTIAAVIWHQGESDCLHGLPAAYKENFLRFYRALCRDLDLSGVPFIIGELGAYLANNIYSEEYKNYPLINQAMKEIAEEEKMIGLARGSHLLSNPDMLHFSAASQYEYGHLYYKEFEALENKNRIFPEKPSMEDAFRTGIEHL